MNNYTSALAFHVQFENPVGRLLAHPSERHISIEYHQGRRQPSEVLAFVAEAGRLLAQWGWDKLLTAHTLMPGFTPEETEELCAYWRANPFRHSGILHGAQLLPHTLFACLSWKGHLVNEVPLPSYVLT